MKWSIRRYNKKNGRHVDGDGTIYYYKNHKLHRKDGPAVEDVNGDKIWYKNGKLHREDGPALEYKNGTEVWYLDGLKYNKIDHMLEVRRRRLKILRGDEK